GKLAARLKRPGTGDQGVAHRYVDQREVFGLEGVGGGDGAEDQGVLEGDTVAFAFLDGARIDDLEADAAGREALHARQEAIDGFEFGTGVSGHRRLRDDGDDVGAGFDGAVGLPPDANGRLGGGDVGLGRAKVVGRDGVEILDAVGHGRVHEDVGQAVARLAFVLPVVAQVKLDAVDIDGVKAADPVDLV